MILYHFLFRETALIFKLSQKKINSNSRKSSTLSFVRQLSLKGEYNLKVIF